jgi:hypothetical protein
MCSSIDNLLELKFLEDIDGRWPVREVELTKMSIVLEEAAWGARFGTSVDHGEAFAALAAKRTPRAVIIMARQ